MHKYIGFDMDSKKTVCCVVDTNSSKQGLKYRCRGISYLCFLCLFMAKQSV